MKTVLWRLGYFLIVVGLLAGCRTAVLYNVNDASIVTASGKSASMEEVKGAIIAAGSELGWNMTPTSPGHIEGSIAVRGHAAVVDIPYSTQAYSIIYKSSTNLKYDPESGIIHSNYNGWIQKLDNSIRAKLGVL